MRYSSLCGGVCLSLFMGQAALAETADWSIGSDAQLAAVDFAQIEPYVADPALLTLANDLPRSSTLVEPAAYTEQESFLHFALRRIEANGVGDYGVGTFFDQSSDVWVDFTGILAHILYKELTADYAGHKSFHFEDEGWFGKNTYSLGMDKLGHAYGGFIYADYFTQRITHSRGDAHGAGITGALLSFGVQGVIEITDGFASEYGFSNEDLMANALGAGFSALRTTIPGLAEKVDFRMEYDPWVNNQTEFQPFNSYTNQKYLLAVKLSGFEQFEDSPLRFVELQAGYFARGFGHKGSPPTGELRRVPYFAIGVNLAELFNVEPVRDTVPALIAQRAFQYFQVPYTYAATTNK